MQVKLPLFPRTQITHPPEYKGKPKRYPIVYPPQPLMKASFKQLKQMFPNTNEHDHVLKWAADNIKHNDLQSLYLRHYKQNPQVHTEENKNKLGHINGMMDISPEIKNVKIDKKDTLESAFKKYDDAEHTWRQGNGARYVEPQGKPVVDFGDGWGWFDLGRSACKKEGAALGHCGNTGDRHEDDRILSLRKIVKVGDKTFHEPALTFINNHGWLGEMKGRANSKPAESYHKRIVELLKHPDIKGMIGAGYMPENNFHFDDLSPEHKNQVRMSNSNLVDLRSNHWSHDQRTFAADSVPKIEKYQHTVKDIFKEKKLREGLNSGKLNIDELEAEDLRLLTNHHLFQKHHLLKLIDELDGFSDSRMQAQALMAAKNSKHLDDELINHWVDSNGTTAAKILGNKLNSQHIDKLVEKYPQAAANHLHNHKDFNVQHIDKIIEKNPEAAYYLSKNPLLNAQHIDELIEKKPWYAAYNLHEHPSFNAQNIYKLIEKDPQVAAEYLHNRFNVQHIDELIEKKPWAAAYYLRKHKDFNAQHIDKIIEKDPKAAARDLRKHKDFNAQYIDKIIEKDPKAAAKYLHKHKDFNSQHIDKIIEKDPEAAAKYLRYLTNFNPSHVRKLWINLRNVQKSLQKSQKLKKVLVSKPSEGITKIAQYDGMRPEETHVSTTRIPHERFGSVYVHHFASDENTNARHLVSMHHDPHQNGVSVLLAARQNEDEPMTVYSAATHPNFQGNRLNYVALREAVKSHGTLHSDVMQSMPAFKNWNRLKQEAGFKVNMTKPFRDASTDDASLMPHIAQYSKQSERLNDMKKAITPEQQKENIKKQRELKNKEIIAKLKTKTVDKAPSKKPAVPPKLLIPHYDTPEGIPVYIKSHPSHDSLVGVHVHVDELPEVEHYKFLDEPKIDNALSSAGAKGFPAVYVSTSKKTPKIEVADHPPEILDDVDPKILESMKNRLKKPSHLKLVKALWPSAPKVTNGQYAKPFSMGGTKKEKKTIYSHFSHPEHAKFNAQEHLDAYWRHQEKIKQNPKMEPSLVSFHKQQAQQHWDKSKNLVDAHDTSRRIEENKPK